MDLRSKKAAQKIIDSYPSDLCKKIKDIRNLIYQVADEHEEIGKIKESVRWGQPSYLTEQTSSGTLIRLGIFKKQPEKYGIFFHCQTDLVPRFRHLYPELTYIGNRAIVFDKKDKLPIRKIKHCIFLALTYYL